ncbi:MAG: glycosyltransferase family 2 protein, partial [Clostridia bacterium]|nr:glycosyltransferase family 2 protein [Clostridia bacterium]
MGNALVTVAVPIYRAEKYLDRCISSLTEQTYSHLEIILVDDCSPDRCPQICDEWAAKDSRIRVIHKEKNEGQGLGRNQALDIATGDYICFLDSDDYLMPESIEHLVAAVEGENAELAVFGLRNIA